MSNDEIEYGENDEGDDDYDDDKDGGDADAKKKSVDFEKTFANSAA